MVKVGTLYHVLVTLHEISCQSANKACRNTFGENTTVFARSNTQSDDIPVNKCILVLFYRP